MISPWVEMTAVGQKGHPNVDPWDPNCYQNKVIKRDAALAELYDFVPKKLHKLMENHTHFADLVSMLFV